MRYKPTGDILKVPDGYYQSAWWIARSRKARQQAENKCQWNKFLYKHDFPYSERMILAECDCGNLDVHHITYKNIYKEKDEDLVVLCRGHHIAVHLSEAAVCRFCGDEIFPSIQDAERDAMTYTQDNPGHSVGDAIDYLVNASYEIQEYCSHCEHHGFDDFDHDYMEDFL